VAAREKRGSGNLLTGVWGCPPDIKVPQACPELAEWDWGIQGVD